MRRLGDAARSNPVWAATTPRSALALWLAGVTSISHPSLPSVDLGCCGRRLVKVNNGGLYSEGEWRPNTRQVYSVEKLLWKPSPPPGGCKEPEPVVSSPLGWVNLTPLELRDSEGECPTLGGATFASARLEPLVNYRVSTACASTGGRGGKPGIRPYSLGAGWEPAHAAGLEIFKRDETLLAGIPGTGAYMVLGGEISLSSPHYEHTISILGPGTFYTVRTADAEVEALAIAVAGPLGSISLASASGLLARVTPGRIDVFSEGRIRLASGGPLTAARLLHEDAATLSLGESCGRGLGHVRSHNAVFIVGDYNGKSLEAAWYSPVADGLVEVRAYAPLKSVIIEEPEGLSEIPVSADLVRIPMPFGSCGKVRIGFGGGLFLRLRRRRG
ncbi:MAG: hypothetical protein F7C34_00485 [Desulfurococcales archaeon]|nr:hypothetical protein [Desulfurococcales archaeon]